MVQKVVKEQMPTFHQRPWNNQQQERQWGFTLVEILIVVALIGLIMTFAMPSVTSYFRLSLDTSAREMASIIKETYNSTVITGYVHRIAYDLDKNTYWVEKGPDTVLLDTQETKRQEERRKKFGSSEKKDSPPTFQQEKSITRNKISLPRGVKFKDILTEQFQEPIDAGIAYTHFFPHGITEQTIIHLNDSEEHKISLVISSLIGRTKVIPNHVSKLEAF